MSLEHIKTGREERIVTLYQVDPGFYKKILSRNSSLSFSRRISTCHNPGEVPFTWEMQPGKPREAPNIEIVRSIRLPPAVHGLNLPKPRFHHSGPMTYLSKHVKKVKKIKNMQLRQSPAVPSLSMPKPEVKFLKSSEKVKKIKNTHIGKKIKKFYVGKKSKAKSVVTDIGYASGIDESDGFRSCNIDGDFTPSLLSSDASGSSLSSSFSFNQLKKLPKRLRSWSLPMEVMKWRNTK